MQMMGEGTTEKMFIIHARVYSIAFHMLALECFKATLKTSKLYTLNHTVTVALA